MLDFYEGSGINPKYFSGQCYGGAPNLQSEKKGVASFILKESENAVVTHCCMHNLNLSISGSVRIQLIGNAIESYKNSIFFFKLSPKKETLLNYLSEISRLENNRRQILIGMCKARWSERDLTYEHFHLALPFTVERDLTYEHFYLTLPFTVKRDLTYEHFYLALPFTVEALEFINSTHTEMESFEKK